MSIWWRVSAGITLRRARKSSVTSAADWPDPMTATRRARWEFEIALKIPPMDVAYAELCNTQGCLITGDITDGTRGEPPGDITTFSVRKLNDENVAYWIETYWF